MALTLQEMDIPARSWQGWQVPLITTSAHSAARIEDIPADNINAKFAEGMKVAVVAGFQGISPEGRDTPRWAGAADTTAVAFAAAFNAERCDIYTDVDGVYTTTPRRPQGPQTRQDRLRGNAGTRQPWREGAANPLGQTGHALQRQAARAQLVQEPTDTAGTLVCDEELIVESKAVSGIAFSRDEAKMTLVTIEDRPGIAASIFGPLADAGVNVDMIVQNVSETDLPGPRGRRHRHDLLLPIDQMKRAEKALNDAREAGLIKFDRLEADTNVAKVSVVGIGMRSHAGVAARMFKTLSDEGVNIKVIATSEIKISVLIDRKYMELAVQALHDAFELEKSA